MRRRPRPIDRQTIVITGAAGAVGGETAIRAARRGADLVLADDEIDGLNATAERVRAIGKSPLVIPTNPASTTSLERLAGATIEHFGRIDTWIADGSAGAATLDAVLPFLRQQEFGRLIFLGDGPVPIAPGDGVTVTCVRGAVDGTAADTILLAASAAHRNQFTVGGWRARLRLVFPWLPV